MPVTTRAAARAAAAKKPKKPVPKANIDHSYRPESPTPSPTEIPITKPKAKGTPKATPKATPETAPKTTPKSKVAKPTPTNANTAPKPKPKRRTQEEIRAASKAALEALRKLMSPEEIAANKAQYDAEMEKYKTCKAAQKAEKEREKGREKAERDKARAEKAEEGKAKAAAMARFRKAETKEEMEAAAEVILSWMSEEGAKVVRRKLMAMMVRKQLRMEREEEKAKAAKDGVLKANTGTKVVKATKDKKKHADDREMLAAQLNGELFAAGGCIVCEDEVGV
ncbi:hypothetical protein MMC30_003443 [Trapelia coarctata]|nr:hypothetical protein [Trapelia coarctata]